MIKLINKNNISIKDSTTEVVEASVLSEANTLMHRGTAGEVYSHAFFYASDSSLKENVKPLNLENFDLLNPVSFTWKETGTKDIGFIAQEVQEVLPEAVVEQEYLSISLTPIVAALVKEVKSLKQKVKELEDGPNS